MTLETTQSTQSYSFYTISCPNNLMNFHCAFESRNIRLKYNFFNSALRYYVKMHVWYVFCNQSSKILKRTNISTIFDKIIGSPFYNCTNTVRCTLAVTGFLITPSYFTYILINIFKFCD